MNPNSSSPLHSLRLDTWHLVRRVAQLGSMNKTAADAGLDVGRISSKIRALEAELGFEIFRRNPHSVALTARGTAMLTEISPLLDQFEGCLQKFSTSSDSIKRTLKIKVPNGTIPVFIRWFKAFREEFPDFDIELTDNKSIDLGSQMGFDVAVFCNLNQKPPGPIERLGDVPTFLVASPKYLETHPKIISPKDLDSHCLISCFNWNTSLRCLYGPDGATTSVKAQHYFCVDCSQSCLQAALEGIGIGWGVPSILCRDALSRGDLVRLLQPFETVGLSYYLSEAKPLSLPSGKTLGEWIANHWQMEFGHLTRLSPAFALD